jgi:outer membrane protein insertion porin family
MRFLLALVAIPLFAQTEPFPIEILKVTGQERIAPEKILAISGLKLGMEVSKADFDAARARLLATGAFETVGYVFKPSADKKGYDATLQVVEAVQVFPYRFEDLAIDPEAARAALRKQEPILGDEIPASKQVLDRYNAVLQKMAGDKVKVTARVVTEADGESVIVFGPNIPHPQIAEVKFAGNQVLPSTQLMRALADVAVGTPYSESQFRQMLDSTVRPLYEARGRIRVSFPKITTENSMLADGVAVITTIDEGPAYSFGSFNLAGIAPQDKTELLRVANVQPNDVANFDDVKAGIGRVIARFHSRGYMQATSRIDRSVDDKAHKVDVTATIDAGPQFTMGKLDIKGLDINSEPVIRKMWTLKPGAPFQPEYPDSFLKDIRAQDLFDNLGKTKAETKVDDSSHTVDVTLMFTPAPPAAKKRGPGE